MKKISENRLRQIIKEELDHELNKQNEYELVKKDIEKIAEKLAQLEAQYEASNNNTEQLDEWLIPALIRGGMWGAGALGAAKLLSSDDEENAVDGAFNTISGEIEMEDGELALSDSMQLALKKLIIQKILSGFNIDGTMNSVITNALAKRSVNDIVNLIIDRDCETFVEYTWDALVQWGVQIIQDPISHFSHTMLTNAPIIKTFVAPAYGDSIATMLFGGVGAQEVGRMFQENDDVVNFLETKIKPQICEWVDKHISGINPSQLTGSILNMFTQAVA